MLLIKIVNDRTGTNEKSNYNFEVYVNRRKIYYGAVRNHNRRDGWRSLLKEISKQGSGEEDRMKELAEIYMELENTKNNDS